jgi:hypothetical protein
MANKRIWLRMLVMVLAFGMVLVGCDTGTGGNSNNGENDTATLKGTWILSEDSSGPAQFIFTEKDFCLGKGSSISLPNGTYTYDGTTVTFVFNTESQTPPPLAGQTGKAKASVAGNVLTFSEVSDVLIFTNAKYNKQTNDSNGNSKNNDAWALSAETINGEWSIALESPSGIVNFVLTASYPNWNWKDGEGKYLNKGTLSIDTAGKTITFTATHGSYAEHDGTLESLRPIEDGWSVKHSYEEISKGKIKFGEITAGSSYFDNAVMTKL